MLPKQPHITNPHICTTTQYKTHTLQTPHIHTPTQYKPHTYTHPHNAESLSEMEAQLLTLV
jgi:hypothetical protein